MAIDWKFAKESIDLGGIGLDKIASADGRRQQDTAESIISDLRSQPGVILADEVGMGKTYVALAVIASVLLSQKDDSHPVIVMMPPNLLGKWKKEWDQFKRICCTKSEELNKIPVDHAESPVDFLRFLSLSKSKRPRLIWMKTTCFYSGLDDGWIKLAFIRLAKTNTRLSDSEKSGIYKWATSMVRLRSNKGLTQDVIEKLMILKLSEWNEYLISEGILVSDVIPHTLLQHQKQIDFRRLASFLRNETPGYHGPVSEEREIQARKDFNSLCKEIYSEWLQKAKWRASLLVLDEAHHAKNDGTRLAGLFRSKELEESFLNETDLTNYTRKPMMHEKFDRMLFLTATPFQLGHKELMRVVKSFAAVKWRGSGSPQYSREYFYRKLVELEEALSKNRLAGKRLDDLWGRLDKTIVYGQPNENSLISQTVEQWWESEENQKSVPLVEEIKNAVRRCSETKERAQSDSDNPWVGLKRWVIRHNRPHTLPAKENKKPCLRRKTYPGGEIAGVEKHRNGTSQGLPLGEKEAAPFFVAARAQGELSSHAGKGNRAIFAEGLCSSYEAFHHTRDGRDPRDTDDSEVEQKARHYLDQKKTLIPLKWYESHVARLIPSKDDPADATRRYEHPKIRAVIQKAVELWLGGEKVLIFCFYRQTATALREHLMREVENAAARHTAEKLGIVNLDLNAAKSHLTSISNRLRNKKGPFRKIISDYLENQISKPDFAELNKNPAIREKTLGMLTAYLRSPSYIARYLPLDTPEIRESFLTPHPSPEVTEKAKEALKAALNTQTADGKMSLSLQIEEFLRFIKTLAVQDDHNISNELDGSQLEKYLEAVSVETHKESEDALADETARSYKTIKVVRMVYGETKHDVRERIMFAFNSPLFPEILVSSAVLAEGVDLHRFCRHVIHHDLCWNPSTLEQRTGRLDRIRCKAEIVGEPIIIYEPYIAGSADEKMYRVLKDRERWFQIVMGQKFEFDEKSAEEISRRVPLPDNLAKSLVFDLRRHIATVET